MYHFNYETEAKPKGIIFSKRFDFCEIDEFTAWIEKHIDLQSISTLRDYTDGINSVHIATENEDGSRDGATVNEGDYLVVFSRKRYMALSYEEHLQLFTSSPLQC